MFDSIKWAWRDARMDQAYAEIMDVFYRIETAEPYDIHVCISAFMKTFETVKPMIESPLSRNGLFLSGSEMRKQARALYPLDRWAANGLALAGIYAECAAVGSEKAERPLIALKLFKANAEKSLSMRDRK